MHRHTLSKLTVLTTLLFLAQSAISPSSAFSQDQASSSVAAEETPQSLGGEEMGILVARIALYPDDLVAVISASSLYPLQVVEAERFLEAYVKNKSLKPRDSWDGSVISLLNYPEIVMMMSGDLDWTQTLGRAITYQQQDVLAAIQQLREEAVIKGVIKTDDNIRILKQADNIVIQPAKAGLIYIPLYDPQVLYAPGYPFAPVTYYSEPYPYYYNPAVTFFAGAVTGAVWAGAIDWDDWGIWGGNWHGPDIDIDCKNCLNNVDLNGKVNFGDIDWKNVDRSRISFDKDQFANINRATIKNGIQANGGNALRVRTAEIKRENIVNRAGGTKLQTTDIRKTTLEELKAKSAGGAARAKTTTVRKTEITKREVSRTSAQRTDKVNRTVGKPKVATRIDNRLKISGLGEVDRGKVSQMQSDRGRKSMGGGQRGGSNKAIKRPAGRRS